MPMCLVGCGNKTGKIAKKNDLEEDKVKFSLSLRTEQMIEM